MFSVLILNVACWGILTLCSGKFYRYKNLSTYLHIWMLDDQLMPYALCVYKTLFHRQLIYTDLLDCLIC